MRKRFTLALIAVLGLSFAVGVPAADAQTEGVYGNFRWSMSGNEVTITAFFGTGTAVIPAAINGNPVRVIGNEAFRGRGLTNVTIPNSVTTIGNNAFANNQLTSVTIPHSVRTIGDMAFANNNLTNAIVPQGLLLRLNTFQNNASNFTMARVQMEVTGGTYGNFRWRMSPSEVTLTNALDRVSAVIPANSVIITDFFGTGAVVIPTAINGNPVRVIGRSAFARRGLTSVTIPNSVIHIECFAFIENNLTSVTIPNSVTYIGMGAFGHNRLTRVTIGANVRIYNNIGGAPFDNSLDGFYVRVGRQAGTYTRPNINSTVWTRQ